MTESLTTTDHCQLASYRDPIPDIIPFGGITLFAGAPNVGKSALIATMTMQFRDHAAIFGHQPAVLPDIGIVAADRSWARGAGVWFDRAGIADIKHYSLLDDVGFDPRSLRRKFERTARLAEFVDKLKLAPGGLVFVDPIGVFLGGNLLDYDGCMIACHEIRAMLRSRQLSLIGTAHSSKLRAESRARYARVQDQILGSTALLGFSDTQCYLAGPEETGVKGEYCFMWNSHLAPAQFVDLVRDKRGLFTEIPEVDETGTGRVLGLLPEDGTVVRLKTLSLLAAKIPLTQRSVQRALDKLVDRGLVVKVGHGRYSRALVH